MIRRLTLLSLALLLATPVAARDEAMHPDMAKVVRSNNDLGFDLYRVVGKKQGNLFFSPYSISSALNMTYAGARGNTAKQMAKALRLTLSEEKLHPASGWLMRDLNGRAFVPRWGPNKGKRVKPYTLVVANSLWGQKGYAFLPAFRNTLQKSYAAGLRDVDYEQQPEQARKQINEWVEKQTRDKIKELIQRGQITPATRLALVNAIYFKSKWLQPFNERWTRASPFHLSASQRVDVPTMLQTEHMRYAKHDAFTFVELPYEKRQLSMLVFVPNEVDGLARVERALDADLVEKTRMHAKYERVALRLPKFKVTSSFELSAAFKALGMTDAFTHPAADFSGMAGNRELYIGAIVHKAFVAVDESGTEAAAATAVLMKAGSVPAPPKAMAVDRPFLFVIRDNQTGTNLFVGRVVDPR